MRKIGFDNDQYVRLQSERIRQRINKFGGKLYLEFGGKLFDDFHASRVLPGFRPDSKIRMLMEMKAESEVIGSYLCFSMTGSGRFSVTPADRVSWEIWAGLAGGCGAVLLIVILCLIGKKKKKKKAE